MAKACKREAVRRTLPRARRLTREEIQALRLIERLHPELLRITKLHRMYDACGVLPYFGAILTAKGKQVIDG